MHYLKLCYNVVVVRYSTLADYFEEDKDGGNLAFDGRVMEMLSELTVEVCTETFSQGFSH